VEGRARSASGTRDHALRQRWREQGDRAQRSQALAAIDIALARWVAERSPVVRVARWAAPGTRPSTAPRAKGHRLPVHGSETRHRFPRPPGPEDCRSSLFLRNTMGVSDKDAFEEEQTTEALVSPCALKERSHLLIRGRPPTEHSQFATPAKRPRWPRAIGSHRRRSTTYGTRYGAWQRQNRRTTRERDWIRGSRAATSRGPFALP